MAMLNGDISGEQYWSSLDQMIFRPIKNIVSSTHYILTSDQTTDAEVYQYGRDLGSVATDAALSAAGGATVFKVGGKIGKVGRTASRLERASEVPFEFNLQLFADTPKLPDNARVLKDPKAVYGRLEKYHGIEPKLASQRLHEIKASNARGPADNVLFDMTGNVFDPKTKEWLGSLTQGGAQTIK